MVNKPKSASKPKKKELSPGDDLSFLAETIIATAGVGIYIVQHGKFVYVSELYQKITGYTDTELIGTSSFNSLYPEDREKIRNQVIKCLKRGSFEPYEYRFVKKSNELIWILETVASVMYKGEKATLGSFMDITERKRAENAMVRMKEELQIMLDLIPAWVFYKDKENRFIKVNEAFCKAMGLPQKQLEGKSLYDIYPKDQADAYLKDDLEVINSGKPKRNIIEPLTLPDRILWAQVDKIPYRDKTGNIIGIIGFSIDITERKQAEEKILQISAIQNLILENSSMGIALISNSVFDWVNSRMGELLMLPLDQIQGASTRIMYTSEEAYQDLKNFVYPRLARGERTETVRQLKRGDGTLFWCRVIGQILDPAKPYGSCIWMFEDITQHKEAEEAMQDVRKQLQNAYQLAHIGSWTWSLADDTLILSEEIYRMTGLDVPPNGYREKKHPRFYTEESWNRLKEASANSLKTGKPSQIELEVVRPDGQHIWINWIANVIYDKAGKVSGLSGTSQDITESKIAEDKLRKYAAEVSNLYNTAACGYHSLGPDGKFRHINDTELKWLGYDREEIIGKKTLGDLLTPESIKKWEYNFAIFKEQGWIGNVEYDVVRKDGSVFPVLINTEALMDKDGNFLESRTTVFNITDIKNFQTELQKKNQEFVETYEELQEKDRELNETNEKLTDTVNHLEGLNIRSDNLREMGGFLLSCSTLLEISPVIMQSMKKLFPDTAGALFLMSPSRTDLESVVKWGDFPEDTEENVFSPDACWALTKGGLYMVDDLQNNIICRHLHHPSITAYACLPLMAKSDVLGLLNIRKTSAAGPEDVRRWLTSVKNISYELSELLSLSVSNIRLREELSIQAIKDPLTGLFNRRYMEESFRKDILHAARKQESIGIIMIDIDNFKTFNDLHGHAAGDAVLIALAGFFKSRLRGGDEACRYGGEEFVFILPESSLEDTNKRAGQLAENLKTLMVSYSGRTLGPITLSMGISAFPLHGARPEDLLRAADDALYRAKQAGRNRIVLA